MTTHCGKLFHLAGTAHRKCGARIDGSDRFFQCENCRAVDEVIATLAPGSTAKMNDDGEMISDERLEFKLKNPDICTGDEIEMARELLALRKAVTLPAPMERLRLVEAGGRYQYCTLCGAKRVAE